MEQVAQAEAEEGVERQGHPEVEEEEAGLALQEVVVVVEEEVEEEELMYPPGERLKENEGTIADRHLREEKTGMIRGKSSLVRQEFPLQGTEQVLSELGDATSSVRSFVQPDPQ